MQQSSQVEGEVAGIGEHGFFGGAAAEAGGLKLFEELFVDVRSEALELAADGGLRDAQQAGDFEQRVLVEEIGGEQEAVFGWKLREDLLEGVGKPSEFGGLSGGSGCGGGGFVAGFRFREWGFAPGAAMVVNVALGERGAEPAHERAAAGVAGQRRAAFAGALGEAEELGVERVGEVFAERG